MCTGFIFKKNDTLLGFNLDVDPNEWDFRLVKNDKVFALALTIDEATYYTHGVNSHGNFACLPYMNSNQMDKGNGKRIDLIVDDYLKDNIGMKEVLESACYLNIRNTELADLHALVACKNFMNNDGFGLIIEPGIGVERVDDIRVISNFPLLASELGDNPFYGIDRYNKLNDLLCKSSDNLSPLEALKYLNEVKQVGTYATRISFVYSTKENKVYYFLNGDISKICEHQLKE